MATLIRSLNSCKSRMTGGERRFAEALKQHLEDDYLVWYDVPIGRRQRYPDFIVLHPSRGLFVLEVKDWRLSSIESINPETVTLLTPNGSKSVQNPLEQARDCALAINTLLERDPLLVQAEGRYRGKLAFPYSYGVVLANITRKQFDSQPAIGEIIEPHRVFCQDEITDSVDSGLFQQKLWDLCTYEFGDPLTPTQIDRVRWHLFPEIRIVHNQLTLFEAEAEAVQAEEVIPDILRVMDLEQERLARSLGTGHRIIHGVAGSGKTLILAYRCLHLAQEMTKPMLVLCFNVALAARLRHLLHEKGVGQQVVVRHFHGWCHDLLRSYRVERPSQNQYQGEAYLEALVQTVMDAVEQGKIPRGIYGSVMIDEGHDFQADWFQLAAQMVDPESNALLILYDDAQTLYEKKQGHKFSFKSVGIQAQGRTTILHLNYRNTVEILNLAYEFAQEMLIPTAELNEDGPVLVKPQTAGRSGPKPTLKRFPSLREEAHYLSRGLQKLHDQGRPWNEMAVLYRFYPQGKELATQMKQAGTRSSG